jgi:hypothetical protein
VLALCAVFAFSGVSAVNKAETDSPERHRVRYADDAQRIEIKKTLSVLF